MQVTVLGAGAWGTAIAGVLCRAAPSQQGAAPSQQGGLPPHDVVLWTWQPEHARSLEAHRENREFLPGAPLPPALAVTSDMRSAVEAADVLVFVVPSQALRQTAELAAPFVRAGATLISASKGIEESSLGLPTEVLAEVFGVAHPLVALSGPSFAREVVRGVPTNLVAASTDAEAALFVQKLLSRERLRVYTSADPIGVEVGGALKNVIAIAAGAADGLGFGENTRAALITRGVAEMARLVRAKGGQMLTTAGLSGLGDLVLTSTGDSSRNRTLGRKLGGGMSLAEALASSDGVAEGYVTSKSAYLLAERLAVDLPITQAVFSVLHEGLSPSAALGQLLSRPLRGEWE